MLTLHLKIAAGEFAASGEEGPQRPLVRRVVPGGEFPTRKVSSEASEGFWTPEQAPGGMGWDRMKTSRPRKTAWGGVDN